MSEKKKEEKIGEALLKVALGYQVAEVTEEYAEVDGEWKLMKRKKTKKDVPPDLKAVQLLMGSEETRDFSGLSDEELETEKNRLLGELKKEVETSAKNEVKKSVEEENGESRCEVKEKKSRPKPRKKVVKKKA